MSAPGASTPRTSTSNWRNSRRRPAWGRPWRNSLATAYARHGAPSVLRAIEPGSHDTGRALRTERHRTTALVLERVHLLGHHVGGIAGRAREHLGVLERRRLDVPEPEEPRQLVGGLVQAEHRVGAVRQQVLGAAGRREVGAHQTNSCRNGLDARSRPTVVSGPCPGSTGSASGNVRNRRRLACIAPGSLFGEIRPADRAGEHQVAGEQHDVAVHPEGTVPGGVTGRVHDLQRVAREAEARRHRRSSAGPSPG